MAVSVPVRDVTPQDLAAMRVQLAHDLQTIVGGVSGGQDVVYRDLRPTDLNNGTLVAGLQNPAVTANTYTTDVYSSWTALGPQQAVGIYGYADLSVAPFADEFTFVAGPYTLSICVVDQAYANTQDTRVLFWPPLVWVPNEHLRIDVISRSTLAASLYNLQWIGILAEITKTVVPPRQLVAGANGQPRVPGMV